MSVARSTVLIMGHPQDEHAQMVGRVLRYRGVDTYTIDSSDFPAFPELACSPGGDGFVLRPRGCPRFLAAAEVSSVYWRNYNRIPKIALSDPEQAHIAQNDARGLFESFLGSNEFRWVNGLNGFELHQRKPLALKKVAALGVTIPRSIITNSPEALREFCVTDRSYIFKPVQGGAHAQRLESSQLSPDHLELLRLAPITVQEEVRGTNIRVFVAGQNILACEVRSSSLDFRDDPRPAIIEHKLPSSIVAQSLRIATELHLNWTGIDYRLNEEGEYVFLEANPSPMFIGFEAASGVRITDMFVDHLLNRDSSSFKM
jgi:glutathione synthase/RimK-type ligase-like ATP-grasp enzyme